MRSFARRSTEVELMDGDAVTPAAFAACLHDLARVNTVTLARRPTLHWLAAATSRLLPGDRFTLLDVGFGDGDMLRAVRRSAQRRGLAAGLTGVDLNPRSALAASAATTAAMAIEYRTGDAFTAVLPVSPDYIICSQVTHHLPDEEIIRLLRWMDATARKGWFVSDLHRHWFAFYGFKVLAWAARWHPFVRHDGPVSIARSFRRRDWERLIVAAGLDRRAVSLRWHLPFRLCVERLK